VQMRPQARRRRAELQGEAERLYVGEADGYFNSDNRRFRGNVQSQWPRSSRACVPRLETKVNPDAGGYRLSRKRSCHRTLANPEVPSNTCGMGEPPFRPVVAAVTTLVNPIAGGVFAFMSLARMGAQTRARVTLATIVASCALYWGFVGAVLVRGPKPSYNFRALGQCLSRPIGWSGGLYELLEPLDHGVAALGAGLGAWICVAVACWLIQRSSFRAWNRENESRIAAPILSFAAIRALFIGFIVWSVVAFVGAILGAVMINR
jgi:hypothetical protein